jgi:hypothetical protein
MTTRNYRLRFCDNNFAELISSSISYSSQLSAFPFSNSINKFRSRVWKPSGHFLISDSNNKIYINDGSNKTITLTNAAYTTPALLASHIQTQLNASSSLWTVTYDSAGATYKFRIQRSSSGTIRLSQTTNACWNTLGYTLATDQTGLSFWAQEQRNHTEEYAIFDLGYNASITFFAMIAPLDEVFSISTSATVKLMGSNLNQWTNPPLEETLNITDQGIYRFLDDLDDTAYRFWKISIVDHNPNGPEGISIGHISTGFTRVSIDPSLINESESGVLHFDRKTQYTSFEVSSIQNLDRTDKDALDAMYNRLGKITPFYISYDPTNAVTTNIEELTKYVVFNQEPKFTHIVNDIFSMSLAVREVV